MSSAVSLQEHLAGSWKLDTLLSPCKEYSPYFSYSASPVSPTPGSQNGPDGSRTLRIWLPPQFDPSLENPASLLLQSRLEEFATLRPWLQIDVRVKSETNITEALTTTNTAAPALMPDLIALSRANLELAAGRGVLHPLDGLTTQINDPDWYPYAVQMAHIQNTAFGFPFSGDAHILAGHELPLPESWGDVEEQFFIFTGADPQVLFTLSLYLSAGGTLTDEEGLLSIDETILENVLAFYAKAIEDQILPQFVIEYQGYDQTWSAFLDRRADLAVTWISIFLRDPTLGKHAALLPGLETASVPLATGYSWALAGSNPDDQVLAIELAEYLSESQYVAEWTEAAGMLPTRPTALSSWEDAEYRQVMVSVAESAQIIPSQEIISIISPLLNKAVLSVLSGESSPGEAARAAAEQLE
jgi:ABC-type glycerol-3-phosphate transport system substrate-binding protein